MQNKANVKVPWQPGKLKPLLFTRLQQQPRVWCLNNKDIQDSLYTHFPSTPSSCPSVSASPAHYYSLFLSLLLFLIGYLLNKLAGKWVRNHRHLWAIDNRLLQTTLQIHWLASNSWMSMWGCIDSRVFHFVLDLGAAWGYLQCSSRVSCSNMSFESLGAFSVCKITSHWSHNWFQAFKTATGWGILQISSILPSTSVLL